jgi:hypothetical protein
LLSDDSLGENLDIRLEQRKNTGELLDLSLNFIQLGNRGGGVLSDFNRGGNFSCGDLDNGSNRGNNWGDLNLFDGLGFLGGGLLGGGSIGDNGLGGLSGSSRSGSNF